MPYTPPGVTTEIEIANNIVQLPGSTRIISLIGTGRKTKNIAGEQVDQPLSRISSGLLKSGIASINSVYDFSGAGGAQYTYPTTGTGAFGGGYRLSANQVIWDKAANPYPASTTPVTGSNYYASYIYTGTTINITGLVLEGHSNTGYVPAASGISSPTGIVPVSLNIPTVLATGVGVSGIYSVLSGNNTSFGNFPFSGHGINGAGWFQSGISLKWTNGWYTNFADASSAGQVPASGADYFVNYGYSGNIASQVYTQSTGYYNLIVPTGAIVSGNTFITAVTAVTGTIVYPASGTVTGVDSLGFGKDGSGWVVTGTSANLEFIRWSPVATGSYSWSFATAAPLSGTYFVDYTYNKVAADYMPKSFVDYNLVMQEYGPEGIWTLETSGANIGNYTFNALNPLTLGARMAFANGASVVTLVQMSGVGNTAGDFQLSLNQLQSKLVDVIVPLTVGSGSSLTEISTTVKSDILAATLLHCVTMSSAKNKKERVSVGSIGVADVGDSTTTNTYVYTAENSLHQQRSTLVAPGICTVQIQDPAGKFQNIQVCSDFLAVAFGALSCNSLSDVATPLTRQRFAGFIDISCATDNHPDPSYLEIEKDILGGAGVCVIDKLGSNIFVRHQLTTLQTNPAVGEFSVVTATDFVAQAVRFTTEQFIGKKLIPAIVVPAIKSTILATMQALAQDNLISSIGAITVTVNPSNPTEILATVQFVPVFPLNKIRVTFTISTQL